MRFGSVTKAPAKGVPRRNGTMHGMLEPTSPPMLVHYDICGYRPGISKAHEQVLQKACCKMCLKAA